MDVSIGAAVMVQPDKVEVTDVVATVRGILDVALGRCAPGSSAALGICAAWEGLDAVSASSVTVPTLPPVFGPVAVLATARRLVRGGIIRVEPLSAALLLAEALRHLDNAACILAAQEAGEAPPWARSTPGAWSWRPATQPSPWSPHLMSRPRCLSVGCRTSSPFSWRRWSRR